MDLKEAIISSMEIFGEPTINELLDKVQSLVSADVSDIECIRQLGKGWVAQETLAIGLFCALRHQDDFLEGDTASATHDGDSDLPALITGQVLGLLCGFEHLPQSYVENLELLDIQLECINQLITSLV